MFHLDLSDHRPFYEQIKEKIKFLIIGGVLKDSEKIPSVRELAVTMAINPNTIQHAYKELEKEGYIYSVKAKGYFVFPRNKTKAGGCEELCEKLYEITTELMYLGKSKETLISLIEEIYEN